MRFCLILASWTLSQLLSYIKKHYVNADSFVTEGSLVANIF